MPQSLYKDSLHTQVTRTKRASRPSAKETAQKQWVVSIPAEMQSSSEFLESLPEHPLRQALGRAENTHPFSTCSLRSSRIQRDALGLDLTPTAG